MNCGVNLINCLVDCLVNCVVNCLVNCLANCIVTCAVNCVVNCVVNRLWCQVYCNCFVNRRVKWSAWTAILGTDFGTEPRMDPAGGIPKLLPKVLVWSLGAVPS